MMRVLDLFAGIGGFSLGLKRTGGFETAAFCDNDKFCQRVIAARFPGIPIYDDVRTLTRDQLEADGITDIDLICGGFPCQPFSTAAHGRHTAEDLWPEMRRLIAEVQPKWVIAENVEFAPIQRAATDLATDGRSANRTAKRRIGADDCGAPHERGRWWLCAYPDSHGQFYRHFHEQASRLPQLCEGVWGRDNYARALRVPHGVSNRVDRVRALGNAVVPQIPEMIGYAILAAESEAQA